MSPCRTWLTFTCSLRHSCSVSSASGPNVLHPMISVFWKVLCIKQLCLYMIHSDCNPPRIFLLFLCLFFVLFYRIMRMVDQSRCSLFFFLLAISCENFCFYSLCSFPKSTGIIKQNKTKHFFSCRGCNFMLSGPFVFQRLHLLFFALSLKTWERPQWAQLCSLTNWKNCISLPLDQWFFMKPKVGEKNLHTCVYLPWPQTFEIYAYTLFLKAYKATYSWQEPQLWPSSSILWLFYLLANHELKKLKSFLWTLCLFGRGCF